MKSPVAVIMMQRNEEDLLPIWLRYYEKRFSPSNLWVIDDFSSSQKVIRTLTRAARRGVNVKRLESHQGVVRKGNILTDTYRQVSKDYEFVVPADCDEFIYVRTESRLSTTKRALQKEFKRLRGFPRGVVLIREQIRSIPGTSLGHFAKLRKGLLKGDSSVEFDVGSHFPNEDTVADSRFGFVHFHNRTWLQTIRFAREKLVDRVASFDLRDLERHHKIGGDGRHLVRYFSMSREEYYSSFRQPQVDLKVLLRMRPIPFQVIPEEPLLVAQALVDPVNLVWLKKRFRGSIKELNFLRDQLKSTKFLLEFGTGGSTLLALNAGPTRVVSCETDAGYLEEFRHVHQKNFWNLSNIEFQHLNIGDTEKWGYPVEALTPAQTDEYFRVVEKYSDADTVFIDGRFRVAVAAECYLKLREDAKFLIHDFNRQHYLPVLEFLELEEQVGTMALLRKLPDCSEAASSVFRDYVADAR